MKTYHIRTDLALELNEDVDKQDSRYKGIIVKEHIDKETGIKVTGLEIVNKNGERLLKKPKGTYITIEAEHLSKANSSYSKRLIDILSEQIRKLTFLHLKNSREILVVGLGNREVTADSLGPDVVDKLTVNQHFYEENGSGVGIASICPGVMAQTGMETAKIIEGIAEVAKPAVIIAIDALAARNTERLNTTIQLSDRGIHPGSGVGNHREGITQENVGVPVIAIGVPTVIDAPTIVYDAIDTFLQTLSEVEGLETLGDIIQSYSPQDKYALAQDVVPPAMAGMYVTPKDIDCNIDVIGTIIAESINALAAS